MRDLEKRDQIDELVEKLSGPQAGGYVKSMVGSPDFDLISPELFSAAMSADIFTEQNGDRLKRVARMLTHHQEQRLSLVAWRLAAEAGNDAEHCYNRIVEINQDKGDLLSALEAVMYLYAISFRRPKHLETASQIATEFLAKAGPENSHQAVANIIARAGGIPLSDAKQKAKLGQEFEIQSLLPFVADDRDGCIRVLLALRDLEQATEHSRLEGDSNDLSTYRILIALALHEDAMSEDIAHSVINRSDFQETLFKAILDLEAYPQAQASLLETLKTGGASSSALLDAVLLSNAAFSEDQIRESIDSLRSDEGPRRLMQMAHLMGHLANDDVHDARTVLDLFEADLEDLKGTLHGASVLAQLYSGIEDYHAALDASQAAIGLSNGAHRLFPDAILAALRCDRTDVVEQLVDQLLSKSPRRHVALRVCRDLTAFGQGDLAKPLLLLVDEQEELLEPAKELANRLKLPLFADVSALIMDVASRRRTKPKSLTDETFAVVIDPGFSGVAGHHLAQAEFLASFYTKDFELKPSQTSILTAWTPETDDLVDQLDIKDNVHSLFAMQPYRFKSFATTPEAVDNLNLAWEQQMDATLNVAEFPNARIFHWHTTHVELLLGFARWAVRNLKNSRPCFVLGVVVMDYLVTLEDGDPLKPYNSNVYKKAIALLHSIPGSSVIIYTETNAIRDDLKSVIQSDDDVHVLPYLPAALAGNAEDHPTPYSGDTVTFGIVGGSRDSRGLELFPRMIKTFYDDPRIRWIVQTSREYATQKFSAEDISILEMASEEGRLWWLNEPRLDQDTYFKALAAMDCVVMPYGDRYAASGSGVFFEALQLGRHVVVPRQTFMREALGEMAYPHAIAEDVTAESFETAMREIMERKAEISADLKAYIGGENSGLPVGRFKDLVMRALG